MNTGALFQALSQTLFLSLGQALIIYILVKLTLAVFKDLSSSWRYNLLYASLVLISIGFIISFFKYYHAFTDTSLQNTGEYLLKIPAGTFLEFCKAIILDHSIWIVCVYLGGLILQSVSFFIGLYRIKQKKFRGDIRGSQFWIKRIEVLKMQLGISKELTLNLSDKILIPFTVGFLKPVILIPLSMINRLTTEQTEAILLHELAHIKRHDYLMNIIQRMIEIMLFFNPAIWLLADDIKKEREFCCDDLVLRNFDNPSDYARALALLEENRINMNNLAMAVTGYRKFNLFHRIQRLTNMKNLQSNPKHQLLAVLALFVISLSLAWAMPADSIKAKKPVKEFRLQKFSNKTQSISHLVPPAPEAPEALKPSQIPAAPEAPVAHDAQQIPAPPVPPVPIDTNEFKSFINSADWKKQMEKMKIEAEKMRKQFNSPEWKKQIEEMKIASETMKKKFNSPEWKKQMEDMKIETERMKKQFNSPEWKKQMEEMKIETEKMKDQFNNPEWKKQMEEMKIETEKMKKQFNSPEWKKQMEEVKIETKKMKKAQYVL